MADSRIDSLLKRIIDAEDRVQRLESLVKSKQTQQQQITPMQRIKADLLSRGVFSTRFFNVPSDYYNLSLEQRAALLGGKVAQLCKSILFENTAWQGGDEFDPGNAKYYLVIIQYIAKINPSLLRNFVHSLRPPLQRLSKSSFNLQLASEQDSARLTGFEHNALCPFGLVAASRVPTIMCSRCEEVQPPLLFVGGGEVDVKLLVSVEDLKRAGGVRVGRVTDLRGGGEGEGGEE